MYLRSLLRNAEPAALGGDGPAASVILPFPTAQTPAAGDAPAAAATPAVAAVEPSLLEKVTASIQSKGKLLADRDSATLRATTAEARATTAETALTAANGELATLRAERTGIEAALTTAKAEKQDLDTAAASQVAALGFEPAALPAASNAPAETLASLAAQIESEPDNNKRWALNERLEALNSAAAN